jgi:hypothetical protein
MGFDLRCLLRIQIVRLVPLFDLAPHLPQSVVPPHWQRELSPLEYGERMISVWAMGVFLLQWQDLDSQSHHLRTGRAGGRHHSERVAGLVQWCARGVRGEAQWACWIGVQETFQESKSRRRYPSINPGQLQLAAPPFLSTFHFTRAPSALHLHRNCFTCSQFVCTSRSSYLGDATKSPILDSCDCFRHVALDMHATICT